MWVINRLSWFSKSELPELFKDCRTPESIMAPHHTEHGLLHHSLLGNSSYINFTSLLHHLTQHLANSRWPINTCWTDGLWVSSFTPLSISVHECTVFFTSSLLHQPVGICGPIFSVVTLTSPLHWSVIHSVAKARFGKSSWERNELGLPYLTHNVFATSKTPDYMTWCNWSRFSNVFYFL